MNGFRARVDNLRLAAEQIKNADVVIFAASWKQKVLCDGSDKHCEVFTNNHELISYDGWHLTEPGARYAGTLLFRKTVLRELR